MNNDDNDLTDLGFEPNNNQASSENRDIRASGNFVNREAHISNHNSGYSVVKRDSGNHKEGSGEIVIETSIKGLIYSCEVLKDGIMIDGEEVNCSDLQSKENKDTLFRDKYSAAHNRLKREYIAEKNFDEKLRTEGEYIENNEKHCKIITYQSDDVIRTVIEIGGVKFDEIQVLLNEGMKKDKDLVEAKCKTLHEEMVTKYIDEDKFPVNIGWLDKILRKLPFYKKKPIYAFYFLLGIISLFFFLIKLFMCSDYMVNKKKGKKRFEYLTSYAPYCTSFQDRIIRGCDKSHNGLWKLKSKIFTKKSCKSACVDYDFIDDEICDKWTISMKSVGDSKHRLELNPYTITPESELELTQKDFTTVYLKNNTVKTLRFKIIGRRIIDNANSEIIMFANGKTEVSLSPNEEDSFKIRLEHTYIGSFASGEYHGEILFSVFNDDKSVDITESRKIKFTID